MFGRVMQLYVFYFLCYVKDMSTDFWEEQVVEQRVPDQNEDEDIRMDDTRDEHWRDVYEDGDDKNNINALRWEI